MLYGYRYGFIVYIKTDDIYKVIAENVETRFDTSNYELDRPFPKGKSKKLIGLMKDELGGKIMIKSGKTNPLFNLINRQPDSDGNHLYAQDSYEAKYQFLINKQKSTGS